MSLRIVKNGLLDTVQDMGRYGYQHTGINPGGAMDRIAMQVANALTGNEPNEPVIEMHFPAAEIQFEETVLIALAGADFSATVDEKEIPVLQPVLIKQGSVLRFHKQKHGARIYLSLSGGIVSDAWLHSYSTHLKVKAGGYHGRPLQKNDQLLLKKKYGHPITDHTHTIFQWKANTSELYRSDHFRFIAGAEYEWLNDAAKEKLQHQSFLISRESDRMGYRLQSDAMETNVHTELLSAAVTRGTIQLLPDGQLIILMADHQTTGGYPGIGHIISADLSSLAQMQSRQSFSLQQVSVSDAEKIMMQQQMNLRQLQNACTFRLNGYHNQNSNG